jgi:hypothetical protein
MSNATDNNRQQASSERTVPGGKTVGKPSQPCPAGVNWCHRHETDAEDPSDRGYCWSRTIDVAEAQLAVSNGTHDGRIKLWGLGEFEDDAVHLDVANEVAAAITTLLREVETAGKLASSTAAFTWRDILAEGSYAASLPDQFDLAPADVAELDADLAEELADCPDTGALLMWNVTRDEEVGCLAMLTGQTADQERLTLRNATWWVSCGYVHSQARIQRPKRAGDVSIILAGEQFWVWLVPNDIKVFQ